LPGPLGGLALPDVPNDAPVLHEDRYLSFFAALHRVD